MKATDLMIGDWVDVYHELPDESGFYKPLQVTGIHQNDGICFGHDVIESPWIDPEEFEAVKPIPLTPEILEKNGIKLSYTYTHPYRDGEWEEGELEEAMKHYPMYVYQTLNPSISFVIRPNEQKLKVCSSNYKTIVEKEEEVIFVHELQHALRLCGIDKDITL